MSHILLLIDKVFHSLIRSKHSEWIASEEKKKKHWLKNQAKLEVIEIRIFPYSSAHNGTQHIVSMQ